MPTYTTISNIHMLSHESYNILIHAHIHIMFKYITCSNTNHKACHHHHPHPEQQIHHLSRLTPAEPSIYILKTVRINKVETGPNITNDNPNWQMGIVLPTRILIEIKIYITCTYIIS